MNPKVFISIMIVVTLAGGVTAIGQDHNQRKIDRIQRKIEKQQEKLQELNGEPYRVYGRIDRPIELREIERIKADARDQSRVAINLQREAMERSREAMERSRVDMRDRVLEYKLKDLDKLEALKDFEMDINQDFDGKKYEYIFKSPDVQWKGKAPVEVPGMKSGVYSYYSSSSKDNFSINKSLTDESSTADFTYEVKEGADGISVMVNGKMDSGKVVVTIKRPDGEVYNEYTLSSLANVDWKQNLKFEEMEESEYVGKWTISVAAEKANGDYAVQINGR